VLLAYGSEAFQKLTHNCGGTPNWDAVLDWQERAADELVTQYCTANNVDVELASFLCCAFVL
jgi:hypothetical protein